MCNSPPAYVQCQILKVNVNKLITRPTFSFQDVAGSVIHLLKPETIEDWYEQRIAVQQLLGDELFASVSTIIWHLKLCYSFREN